MSRLIILLFSILSVPAWSQFDFYNQASAVGLQDSTGTSLWGAAVSFADFNGDGWDDITLGTKEGWDPLFYVNDGTGHFNKMDPFVSFPYDTKMVLWVDYDNDGDQDLYLNGHDAPNQLFQNTGDLQMIDVTVAAGLPLEEQLSWGAAFGDYNRDGWLDLYTVNRQIDSISNYLYLNNGDGTFTDVTELMAASDGEQLTFCASFIDINFDLWPDLYLANDRIYGNTLFKNHGEGLPFQDISNFSEAGIEIDAMNVGSGDYDNDGDLDIYVTNTAVGGNYLLQNNGNEGFFNVAEEAEVNVESYCWAGLFVELDNDGDEDLYVCSMVDVFQFGNPIFENLGNGEFNEFYPYGLPGDQTPGFAAAYGDYNRDGWMDLLTPNHAENLPKLWRNAFNLDHHWLQFTLEGVESNRDGIGVWVEVWMDTVRQVRYTHCGDSYMTQNTRRQHFGLGAQTSVDSVIIHWPSGIQDRLTDVAGDSIYHLIEGETIVPEDTINSIQQVSLFEVVGNVYPNPSQANSYLPFRLKKAETVKYEIIGIDGKTHLSNVQHFPAGDNVLTLVTKSLPSGSYFVHLTAGDSWQVRRFVHSP